MRRNDSISDPQRRPTPDHWNTNMNATNMNATTSASRPTTLDATERTQRQRHDSEGPRVPRQGGEECKLAIGRAVSPPISSFAPRARWLDPTTVLVLSIPSHEFVRNQDEDGGIPPPFSSPASLSHDTRAPGPTPVGTHTDKPRAR